jgi:DNA repair exonuclease SbcCD ATPase subunit
MQSISARAALRDAIHAHQDALAALENKTALHAKAQALLGSLYAKSSEYDTLDQELADARANSVRLALEKSEVPNFDEVPEGYAAKLMARDNLRDQIATMVASVKPLERDVSDAKAAVDQADRAVEHGAEKVLAEEMCELATDYLAKLSELRAVAYALNAAALRQVRKSTDNPRLQQVPSHVGYIGAASDKRKINMPPVVADALSEPIVSSYERKFGFKLRNDVSVAVNAHWQALLRNPDAELVIPPAIDHAQTASVKEVA